MLPDLSVRDNHADIHAYAQPDIGTWRSVSHPSRAGPTHVAVRRPKSSGLTDGPSNRLTMNTSSKQRCSSELSMTLD
eukprot:15095-Eustigmatos_ZCMA.PRE.1